MVARRYFDRTPGVEGDTGEVTRIINNYVIESTDGSNSEVDTTAVVETIRTEHGNPRTQVIAVGAGTNIIDLSDGTSVHVVSTDGAWTVEFTDVSSNRSVVVMMSIDVTNDGDEPTFPNVTWNGTAPVTADWDAGETNVIRLTRVPFVDRWIAEWVYNGTTPAAQPTVTPVTLTAQYTTPADRVTAVSLGSATLPPGEVYVWFGPVANTDIASFRIFCNHTGGLPAKGSEGDSFVRTASSPPYDLLGVADGDAIPWDTNVDPTGNNRSDYDPNGETTFTIEATWIDGQATTNTFTFDTSNAPIGSDPEVAFTASQYGSGNATHTLTVPNGVDRLVVVQAVYGGPFELTSMTIGGNAMTQIAGASQAALTNQELGVFTAYATDASLSTGSMTLVPTYTSTPPVRGRITYNVWTVTNVASPVLAGDVDYINALDTANPTLTTTLTAVPANSMLFGTGAQKITNETDITSTLGTLSATVENGTTFETRAFTIEDSGTLGDKTSDWGMNGRSLAALVSLEYAASGGGEAVTPIIPAVPTISSVTTLGGENTLTVTWGAATDAVSYELRHGTANPPATTPFAATSPRLISGLASGVLRYVQVRSVSSTGDRSAWSTAVSGTPTGVVTPPPTFSGKYLVATTHQEASMSQGRSVKKFSDLWVQSTWRRFNVAANETAVGNMANDIFLDDAINRYNSRQFNDGSFVTAAGPRAIWTSRLAMIDDEVGRKVNHSKGLPADAAASVADMGKSGSTGSVNRDAIWRKLGNNLNRQYRGYNVWEIVFLSLAHESNGPWSSTYMGRNPNIIGQPVLTGAKNSDYGAEMAAALRRAGATGECDDVHRLALEHVIDILWSINPNIIVGMSPAYDASSSLEGDTAPTLGATWVERAFPDRPIDFLTPTIYARGSNKVKYDGSGSVDSYLNYTYENDVHSTWMASTREYANTKYGCPFGLLEFGGTFAVSGQGYTPGQGETQTDNAMRAFFEGMLEHTLIDNYPQGLAFINHWFSLNWQAADNAGAKQSWDILEGLWGYFPSGVVPTSTGKPTWSTQSGNNYPKTLNYMREQYAP